VRGRAQAGLEPVRAIPGACRRGPTRASAVDSYGSRSFRTYTTAFQQRARSACLPWPTRPAWPCCAWVKAWFRAKLAPSWRLTARIKRAVWVFMWVGKRVWDLGEEGLFVILRYCTDHTRHGPLNNPLCGSAAIDRPTSAKAGPHSAPTRTHSHRFEPTLTLTCGATVQLRPRLVQTQCWCPRDLG
jgi:hypothetical protein